MSRTLINGANQIQAGSVPWAAMATGAIVPLASIVNNGQIILSTGAVAMAAALSMGGFAIQNVGSPVNTTDAATKLYVDTKVSGFEIFGARLMAAANVATLSGLTAMDGVTPVAGNILLLTGQTTASQNGPWVAAAGAWTRPSWWASASVVPEGVYFLIDPDGTTYKNTKWWMTTTGTITVDTTSVAFSQDLSGTVYSAGSGLTLTGTVFSTNSGNGITVTGGNITAVGTGLISVSGAGIALSNSSSNGQMVLGNASNVPTWTSMSGDALLSAAGALTLGTVNGNVGSFGSSSAIPVYTVNAKGLMTASGTAAVVAPAGTLSGTALAAGVVSSSLTSVGTLASLAVSGVATFTVAPVLSALTGFVYANGVSAATASTTVPSTALLMSCNETPTGACNSVNTTFTVAHTPLNNSLCVLLNGVNLRPGAGNDYTVSGGTITTLFAPAASDYVSAEYFY